MAALIPPLPMRGSELRTTLQSLRDTVVFKFGDLPEMSANAALKVGDRGALPHAVFEVVAAATCPANGQTAIDLPGSGLMALLLPSELLADAAAVAADTRPASWFAGVAHLRTLKEGFVYQRVTGGETPHLQTAGGLDLRLVPQGGEIHAAALPATTDPATRLSQASQIAAELDVTCAATGMGTLDCTAPVALVRGTDHRFGGTTLQWTTDIAAPCMSFDLNSPNGGSACRIQDLRIKGPGRTTSTDGLLLVGESTSVALSGLIFERAIIQNVRHARVYGSHAYINSFHGGIFTQNHSALYAPAGLTNVGEKTLDLDCIIADSDWGIINHSSLHYEGERCSYDYLTEGDFNLNSGESGWVRLNGGNWEWDAAAVSGPRVLTHDNAQYGPQRSTYLSAYGTKITVRNPGDWPAQHPFAHGAADILWDTCHTYGVGETTPFLMTGGGRVISENCSFSTNPRMCFFSGEGRGNNFDGGFENTDFDLFSRKLFIRGNGQTAYDIVTDMSIAVDTLAARTGTYGLRATVTGAGTGFKQIYAVIPAKHGGLPCARFWTRAGAATGSMSVRLYHGAPIRRELHGSHEIPIFGDAAPYMNAVTVNHGTDWQKVEIMPTATPEVQSFPAHNEYFFMLIDLNNTTGATGAVDFDDLVLDMFGGRKR